MLSGLFKRAESAKQPPLPLWRRCPACKGTGKFEGKEGDKVELPPTASENYIELQALLAQNICLACRGKGGFETHAE